MLESCNPKIGLAVMQDPLSLLFRAVPGPENQESYESLPLHMTDYVEGIVINGCFQIIQPRDPECLAISSQNLPMLRNL